MTGPDDQGELHPTIPAPGAEAAVAEGHGASMPGSADGRAIDAGASNAVLDVRDLKIGFRSEGQLTLAVKGVSFHVGRGETVALVGESGSGKSVTALSTVQLLGASAEVQGSVLYAGRQMVGASDRTLREIRGNDISFIFQEPMTSLNPLHTLAKQLSESLALHQGLTGGQGAGADRAAAGPRGHPRRRKPPGRLSAPAVGRSAPARDDRHGAGQRAGPADRG
ncbi:oligopeptide/dipeptide ABC transporter ATPase [marine sediment metagenome]|uniref:Oligopeptide/dipeptide ABC transporter ATPase n=1 Tax=marine sediment metagenome TaxID=412755 RepID=A0A1B6NPE3_9ZZZZ